MAVIKTKRTVPLGELKPYENNARTHSEEQIEQIADSIREFGFINPILVDEANGIIAGHGRFLAAKRLGMDIVPCLQIEGLSEAQKKAYILADNRLTELGGWDFDIVNEELAELDAFGFDTLLTGFEFEKEDEKTEPQSQNSEKPEVEFTEILGEEHNYIVLYFDNEIDWLQAETLFDISPKLQLSTRQDGKITESMKRVSVGRVLNGAKALETLRGHYENIN